MKGASLQLEILQASSHWPVPLSTSTCEAIILEPWTTTMSAVMKVQIHYDVPSSTTTTSNGNGFTTVLKLYDRRFGTTLRRRLDMITPKYEPYPCTSSTEAAYCDFICKEEIGPILNDYEEEERSRLLPQRGWSFLDGSPGSSPTYDCACPRPTSRPVPPTSSRDRKRGSTSR